MQLQLGLNRGVSNSEYHADKVYLSSSKLKILAESPQQFYQDVILGNGRPLVGSFLDIGSLTHSLLLEPHLVDEDYAFYPGPRRAGAEFERFKAQNPGRLIMTTKQNTAAQSYARAAHHRPELVQLLQGGEAELSICVVLNGVNVKMRADYINLTAGYILDIKTTSDGPGADNFRWAVSDFGYDFSAALYCLVAEQHFGRPFDFYWGVISKEHPPTADVYGISPITRASSNEAVYKALANYTNCIKTGVWTDAAPTGTPVASTDYVIERI